MIDYPELARRSYYADFEVREACIITAILGGLAGVTIGLVIGWWTA